MDFIGEHLLPGKLGFFFCLLSFISSLGATAAYILSVQKSNYKTDLRPNEGWRKVARIFFLTEVVSVFAIFGILIFLISNHYFEYKYVWQHSSLSLEPKYLLSCFWEGQEGSFILWSIWHCVLGLIIIKKEKQWEAPVMAVVSMVQVCLATMILGIEIFGIKSGSNPFVLLRNSGVLDNAPVFFDATGAMRQDYLSFVRDGNDLNPLLQNYWMVIHPPVLFLGFAMTLIPFAFAIAGLWTKQFAAWTARALPWALSAAGILGLGIMMGAAWAYESLSFGGFWAWDPVENASLVPWLVLVAGVHTLLIYRHTGNALRSTNLFFILSFLLVLYSTYLTRSGDLQDTSVHAFTGEGITVWHLRGFLLMFVLPSAFLFIRRYKYVPFIAKEEEGSAREFWMFIGSLVLFLSGILIILMTSIPIANKIIGLFSSNEAAIKPFAIGEDSIFAYNRVQIFVAIIIGLLSASGLYLKYKQTGSSTVKKILKPLGISLLISGIILAFGNINYREQGIVYLGAIWLALAAAVFSAVANAGYMFTGFKGSLKKAGGAVSHFGFALMLLGILISSSKKEVLSFNTSGIFMNFGPESKEKPGENLTLVKDIPTKMGEYTVTYDKDSAHATKELWFYRLKFEKEGKHFFLYPNAFVNYKGNTGLMANPDSRHYLTHDIFTYISSLPDPSRKEEDTATFRNIPLEIGDTVFYSRGYATVEGVSSTKSVPGVPFGANDSASVATLKLTSNTQSIYTVKPTVINIGGEVISKPDTVVQENLVLQLQKVEGKKITLGLKESDAIMQYVTLKAYKFPFINLLWLGTLLMVIGFGLSTVWRIRNNRKGKLSASRVPREELQKEEV